MADDQESCLSQLEDNHWMMVKSVDPEVFLDYMLQHRVLSDEDCENVRNYFVNRTRRDRMRCFLNILKTKGPENIGCFFQQLGWEYPHVFREIFRQEPDLPPKSYRQDTKSRLSCDLNKLLTAGLDMQRLQSQKECLGDQIRDMEAMLKHQKNEIEDLERENQRLRQYERENHQSQEKLRILNAKNEEIKEENRQFLHEIRTLTLEVQKRRDNEATLQSNLDEMTQQIQEKSLELNMKSKEESDLRAKYEHVRKASMKFQSLSEARNRRQDMAAQVTTALCNARQNDLKQQLEILTDDNKNLEETNRDMCDRLQFMQDLLDTEKGERDQLHQKVCTLEHRKNNLETWQVTAGQKIERYFQKIKELEEQKRKLEEERMHMQTKAWELSRKNDLQFEQQHKLETRLDQLQQSYELFRQEHRYCTPAEVLDRPQKLLPGLKDINDPLVHPVCLSETFPAQDENSFLADVADGDTLSSSIPGSMHRSPLRNDSMTVNPSVSFRRKISQEEDNVVDSDDDKASTASELSSVSSSTFDFVDTTDISVQTSSKYPTASTSQASGDSAAVGNFFIRSNVKEQGGNGDMTVQEGDILYVIHAGQDVWKVMGVDRTNGKLIFSLQDNIPNPDSSAAKMIRRNPSSDSSCKGTFERKNAFRRDGIRHQQTYMNTYTSVYPMRATRKLPVLLLCPSSAMKSVLSCMETIAQDWANIIPDGCLESSTQLFAESYKHNVLPWEIRPKDPQRYNNNLHKFIIIVITLESQEAVPTLRSLLGKPDLNLDFDQEMKYLKERQEIMQRAGLHSATVTVVAGQDNREALWQEVKEKVTQVQNQLFWLETPPRST